MTERALDDYITDEGLDELIDFSGEGSETERGVFDNVSGEVTTPLPPEKDDLCRLHRLVRERGSFTVLEFGVGYSTIVVADALRKNEQDWRALRNPPAVRNRHLFETFVVDTSEEWIEASKKRFPESLRERATFCHSTVEIGTFNDRLCHFYTDLPDVVPDFVYLDGPDPKDVQGDVNGLSFQCDERTVMAGDLLVMEPVLLPGTFVLVDGRTNNARFLRNNFQRNFEYVEDLERDVSTFELKEERLGKYNVLGSDYL